MLLLGNSEMPRMFAQAVACSNPSRCWVPNATQTPKRAARLTARRPRLALITLPSLLDVRRIPSVSVPQVLARTPRGFVDRLLHTCPRVAYLLAHRGCYVPPERVAFEGAFGLRRTHRERQHCVALDLRSASDDVHLLLSVAHLCQHARTALASSEYRTPVHCSSGRTLHSDGSVVPALGCVFVVSVRPLLLRESCMVVGAGSWTATQGPGTPVYPHERSCETCCVCARKSVPLCACGILSCWAGRGGGPFLLSAGCGCFHSSCFG
mmetsp:Transcript_1871/g.4705  ORF Transcript_1871/g.4705 Transcript_1871/m.4705 type:complete len:266 (+) Transcript_1871:1398-2195(+)